MPSSANARRQSLVSSCAVLGLCVGALAGCGEPAVTTVSGQASTAGPVLWNVDTVLDDATEIISPADVDQASLATLVPEFYPRPGDDVWLEAEEHTPSPEDLVDVEDENEDPEDYNELPPVLLLRNSGDPTPRVAVPSALPVGAVATFNHEVIDIAWRGNLRAPMVVLVNGKEWGTIAAASTRHYQIQNPPAGSYWVAICTKNPAPDPYAEPGEPLYDRCREGRRQHIALDEFDSTDAKITHIAFRVDIPVDSSVEAAESSYARLRDLRDSARAAQWANSTPSSSSTELFPGEEE